MNIRTVFFPFDLCVRTQHTVHLTKLKNRIKNLIEAFFDSMFLKMAFNDLSKCQQQQDSDFNRNKLTELRLKILRSISRRTKSKKVIPVLEVVNHN